MQTKIESLLSDIEMYNESYRKGDSKISDSEYDKLVDELRALDPDNDWFKHIEPSAVSSGRKVQLPVPMKSLNKVKSIDEITKWAKSLGLPAKASVVCMPKFDGASLLCNEHTRMAYSRGGTENEGQDCSKHLDAARIITCDAFMYTYGEFMISNLSWEKNFKGVISQSTGETLKSPRNTAAGMINSDEPSELIKYATFFRYGVDDYTLKGYSTFTQVIGSLCATYGQDRLFQTLTLDSLTDEFLNKTFANWRTEYPIDGLVIYVDDLSIWESAGRQSGTGNPLYAIAYKNPEFTESFVTSVKGVTWKVSKSGALKPVVNIDVVDTGDCSMENPTGYNAGWISNMGIAKGAEIVVTRSGGVIPKILSTTKAADQDDLSEMWDELALCPSCCSETKWDDKYVELYCTAPNCSGVRLAKVIHFFTVSGAENMGEESYKKLFIAGFRSVKDILNITPEDILDIDGFGESTVDTIMSNNKKVMAGMDMATLMHASDCFAGIGKVKAQKIIDDMSEEKRSLFYDGEYGFSYGFFDTEEFKKLSKTMQAFLSGIDSFYKFLEETNIPVLALQKQEKNENGFCSGMKVCFSGVRDYELEGVIVKEGGTIASGVSKNTTHLIVADPNASTSKIQKAVQLGIAIMTIENFKNTYSL